MASAHEMPKSQNWLARILTTDFCPWANRFVYWLKEPIGWFVVATIISCIIGLYFSPVGWSLAASLVTIIVVGMVWPLIAVRATRLELAPGEETVHEEDPCRMVVKVRNRLPIPLWGLAVEGYLDSDHDANEDSPNSESTTPLPTVGLASVPPMCQADYGINIHPQVRGLYPRQVPNVACSFPFGIWTARREIQHVSELTVWPKVYSTPGLVRFSAKVATDLGIGSRSGRDGDINGVRDFRRGDSTKHIHWVASARTNSLMVSERSAPQTAVIDIRLDTKIGSAGATELSRRIRIAASIIASLHQQRLPLRVAVGDKSSRIDSKHPVKGKAAFHAVLSQMAMIPIQGTVCSRESTSQSNVSIEITGDPSGTTVRVSNPGASMRRGNGLRIWQVDCSKDLSTALNDFWQEVGHANAAA